MKNFSKKTKNINFGFTLIETVIGVSIFVVMMLAITIFMKNTWGYNTFVSVGLGDIDVGRKIIKNITAEVRTASSANTGAYAINQASASSLTFYSDIYDNGLKERVRYFLNGTTLQKGITVPTGSPLAYNLANEQVTNILTNVTNATIFNYYDKNYDGTTASLSDPIDVSLVRLIKITLTVDKDPLHPPAPITFSTQVSLRNLKDNL